MAGDRLVVTSVFLTRSLRGRCSPVIVLAAVVVLGVACGSGDSEMDLSATPAVSEGGLAPPAEPVGNAGASGVMLGAPCLPLAEFDSGFSGYSEAEVNVELDAPACNGAVCLVNHFRGRVSCPYGQNVPGQEVVPGVSAEAECVTPNSVERITRPVLPQLQQRPPDVAVYCSCRCSGPDATASYCQCAEGLECQELIPDLGFGTMNDIVGSYCVKLGTMLDNPARLSETSCSYEAQDCGEPNPFP